MKEKNILADYSQLFAEEKLIKELKAEIDKFSIISFDIYNTLVKRDIRNPQDIFLCIKKEYNLSHKKKIKFYCGKRKLAALLACRHLGKEEVTIDEIYNHLWFPQSIINELKNMELKFEKELTFCNKFLFDIVTYCHEKNKKIYAISDMYLPQEFIEMLLTSFGYRLDGIYVSSKYGKTKINGKLFDCFLQETNYSSSDILHIGDSQVGDIYGSAKAGIRSFKIPDRMTNVHYFDFHHRTAPLELTIMQEFINNRICEDESRFRQIGYEIVGPFLYSFCIWLHKNATEKNIKKIFFFARDALLAMEIYKTIFGEEAIMCEYFYASRKSLLTPYYVSTGEYIDDESIEQYNIFKDYLDSSGFLEPGNIAVVDDGGYGRPLFTLNELLKNLSAQSTLYSYNFEIAKGFHKFMSGDKSFAYLFNGKPCPTKMLVSNGMFETLISAVHGTTLGYRRTKDGIEPILGNSIEYAQCITEIQQGAFRFAQEWKDTVFSSKSISPDKIIAPFFRFALNPLQKDVEIMGNLQKSDDSEVAFVVYRGREFYRKNPIAWLSDFQNSNWKGGFLKKSFKRIRLIGKIYLFLNAIRLFIWKPKIILGGK